MKYATLHDEPNLHAELVDYATKQLRTVVVVRKQLQNGTETQIGTSTDGCVWEWLNGQWYTSPSTALLSTIHVMFRLDQTTEWPAIPECRAFAIAHQVMLDALGWDQFVDGFHDDDEFLRMADDDDDIVLFDFDDDTIDIGDTPSEPIRIDRNRA